MAKVISAEVRTELTKGVTNRLRRDGRIPAVVYGHEAPQHIHINAHQFGKDFKVIHESEFVTLELGGKQHTVLIKDYQKNVLRNEVTHLDFYEVSKDHLLKIKVPVKIGEVNPALRTAGGMVEVSLHEIEVECLPGALPESIEVDCTKLTSGHAIHVKDLPIPRGVKFLAAGETVVVHVAHIKAEVAAEPAAAEASAATGA